MLAEHVPTDERERRSQSTFLAELDRLTDPFDEHADPVHVTASAVVVGTRGVVLHRHRRLHRWMQPGGHVDAGERPEDAARRETIEETGLAVAHPDGQPMFFHLDVHPAAKGHTHLDLRYLLLGPDDDPRPYPGESPDVRWFTWREALPIADEALVQALVRAAEILERHRDVWFPSSGVAARGGAG
jgi:8-oxo-dGTP pyrophosphatase MutT (NUDIX family)